MTTSSNPEPPILADIEKARNCLGLNTTILPGLGTFRHGARFRGLVEMGFAILGTLWFCKTLFLVAEEMMEGAGFLLALGAHIGVVLASVTAVAGSWVSGVKYGRSALKGGR